MQIQQALMSLGSQSRQHKLEHQLQANSQSNLANLNSILLSEQAQQRWRAEQQASLTGASQVNSGAQQSTQAFEHFTAEVMAGFSRESVQVRADASALREDQGGGPGQLSVYEYAYYHEQESFSFAASGNISTADGREISFDFQLSMSRSFTFESVSARQERVRLQDPLMISLGNVPPSLGAMRFSFDLDGDGSKEQLAVPGAGMGLLVLDRNEDGQINDGSELFGVKSGNGFADLQALDEDGNGWLDENDPLFAKLQIWQPDGEGQGSLQSLKDAGVGAIYLGSVATPFSFRGEDGLLGKLQRAGVYLREDGSSGGLYQIDLAIAQHRQDKARGGKGLGPDLDKLLERLDALRERFEQEREQAGGVSAPSQESKEEQEDPLAQLTAELKRLRESLQEQQKLEQEQQAKRLQQRPATAADHYQKQQLQARSQSIYLNMQLNISAGVRMSSTGLDTEA